MMSIIAQSLLRPIWWHLPQRSVSNVLLRFYFFGWGFPVYRLYADTLVADSVSRLIL